MILLDRYLLKTFVKAWFVCFVSLVSLYVVIDAFSHFEELLTASRYMNKTLTETAATYYGYQVVLIFDRLCSVIMLLAATFTIAWLQRQNELVPLLSAGVPISRILRPVFLGSLMFMFLQTMNREVLMPHFAENLELGADDPSGQRAKSISGGFDTSGILLQGGKAFPQEKVVMGMSCTVPTQLGGTMYHFYAKEARFITAGTLLPDGSRPTSSGWLLSNITKSAEPPTEGIQGVIIPLNTGQIFVKVEQMNFRRMTRSKTWYQYASLMEIVSEMEETGAQQLSCLATQLHQRLAAPLVTLVTIALGLGIFLRESSKNVFLNTGLCLAGAAGIFLCTMIAKYLGDREYISTALAGWLPIMIFGPMAYMLRDGMQS